MKFLDFFRKKPPGRRPLPTKSALAPKEKEELLARLRRDAETLARAFELPLGPILPERANTRRRYGVCYANGTIKIRLSHAATGRALKYSSLVNTLCHELAHLRHMNHGPRFKKLYFAILDYAREHAIYRPRSSDLLVENSLEKSALALITSNASATTERNFTPSFWFSMPRNEIVLDLETQNTFEEVGQNNPGLLKISVVGVYFYKSDSYRTYMENEIPELEHEIARCSLLVGFNHLKFDLPVLEPYFKTLKSKNIPCLDIMEAIRKVAGHRVSLNSVALATLNAKKSGHGLDAVKQWREGRLDELKRYCLDDVKITKEIYDFGMEKKEIYFTAKDPKYKSRVPVDWKPLIHQEPKQLGLF